MDRCIQSFFLQGERVSLKPFLPLSVFRYSGTPMLPRTDVVSDEELCQRFLRGDASALRELIERYASLLVRFAYRFTRKQEDAEDVVQETFIRLYKNLPKLDLSRPIRPWLFHVCVNLCRNLAERRKSLLFSELENAEENGEGGVLTYLESSDPLPDDNARQADSARVVRSALDQLPEKYRLVLTLFYFDGLSYEEIADALSLPLNTVRTHIRRAKILLKGILGDQISSLV